MQLSDQEMVKKLAKFANGGDPKQADSDSESEVEDDMNQALPS